MISALIVATCTWAAPGADRFVGPVPAAVHSYADIPADVRQRLQARLERRQYDEVVDIRRDTISGSHEYTGLRDMHFGRGKLCQTVDRSMWAPTALERGLVYCEGGHCVLVPTVCGNLSRVTRVATAPIAAAPVGQGPAEAPYVAQGAPLPIGPAPLAPLPAAPATWQAAAAVPDPTEGQWWRLPPPPVTITVIVVVPPTLPVPPAPIPEPSTWALMLAGLGFVMTRSLR